jgi:hypothetical protein
VRLAGRQAFPTQATVFFIPEAGVVQKRPNHTAPTKSAGEPSLKTSIPIGIPEKWTVSLVYL